MYMLLSTLHSDYFWTIQRYAWRTPIWCATVSLSVAHLCGMHHKAVGLRGKTVAPAPFLSHFLPRAPSLPWTLSRSPSRRPSSPRSCRSSSPRSRRPSSSRRLQRRCRPFSGRDGLLWWRDLLFPEPSPLFFPEAAEKVQANQVLEEGAAGDLSAATASTPPRPSASSSPSSTAPRHPLCPCFVPNLRGTSFDSATKLWD
jgi:hypothetical protein